MVENPEVVGYIKRQLSAGYKIDQIRQSLLNQGWLESEVNEAVAGVQYQTSQAAARPMEGFAEKKRAVVGFILSLIGGLFILLQGIESVFATTILGDFLSEIPDLSQFIVDNIPSLYEFVGLLGIIFGFIIIIVSILLLAGKTKSGILIFIISIIALLLTPGGWLIGVVLGLIGGVVGLIGK